MVVALAAVLWLVYLVPTWMRRRQYLATELNAVRLQQTLRILAETAEMPAAVRADADARAAAVHRRRLRGELEERRSAERTREAEMALAAARTRAALDPAPVPVAARSQAAVRLRRSRLVVTATLALAIVTTVLGLTPLASAAAPALLIGGVALIAGCLLLLSRFAAVARARAGAAHRPVERPVVVEVDSTSAVDERREQATGWTPVPLPKPLYLSKPAPQRLVSDAALAEARERAVAEQRAREASVSNITAIGSSASDDRYARMGVVDRSALTVTDLDDALRRRRAV
jgi:hypothetical protein